MRVLMLLVALTLPVQFLMSASDGPPIWATKDGVASSLIHQCGMLSLPTDTHNVWGMPRDNTRPLIHLSECDTPRERLQRAVHEIGVHLSGPSRYVIKRAENELRSVDNSRLFGVDLYAMTFVEAAYFYQQGKLTSICMRNAGELLTRTPRPVASFSLCLHILRWCFGMIAGSTGQTLERLAVTVAYLGEHLSDNLTVDGMAAVQKKWQELRDTIVVAIDQRVKNPAETPPIVLEALCDAMAYDLKIQAAHETMVAERDTAVAEVMRLLIDSASASASRVGSWLPARSAGSPPLDGDTGRRDGAWGVGYRDRGAGDAPVYGDPCYNAGGGSDMC